MFNMHITYYIMLCYVSQFLHSSHTVPIQSLLLNGWLVTRQGNERKTSAVAAARRADAMRALQQMRLFIWHLCCTDVLHGSMFAASLLKEVGPRVFALDKEASTVAVNNEQLKVSRESPAARRILYGTREHQLQNNVRVPFGFCPSFSSW